jgi:hypothetical protein
MENTKNKIFPYIIALSALSVSASAAFYSVSGLSKLFAGASTQVMIMAGSLEVAKLVIASLLYQYWDILNKTLRTYLSVATVILVLITSMGIYGYLSAAYQETATKSLNADAQVTLLETKKQNFIQQRDLYNTEKTNLVQGITQLQSGLANNKTSFIDKKGNLIQSTSNANRKSFEKQLDNSNARQSEISAKLDVINDSIFKLDTQIIEAKTGNNTAGELGPLKYLSNLTGASMDSIINYLLLVIIFVFDPLAIALVIAANFAFAKLKKPDPILQTFKENVERIENDLDWELLVNEGLDNEPWYDEEAEHRMDIIGQNGNEGEHYDSLTQEELAPQQEFDILDLNKDGIVDDEERAIAESKINTIENELQNTSLSGWRANKMRQEAEELRQKISNNDNTINYN